jgi:PD-(D/E)XK endonuclease
MAKCPPAPALNLKGRGDLAELMVATDLMRRGHKIAIPYGEDCDFDLVLIRGDRLERVQVKHTRSDGSVISVRCRSHSLTNGKIRRVKHYTAETIDLLAVYDVTSDRCYYLPASELGTGRSTLHLRLKPAKNGQQIGTRPAEHYLDP